MTPEKYYGSISLNNPMWDSLSEDAKDDMTMYSVILQDEKARDIFLDIFRQNIKTGVPLAEIIERYDPHYLIRLVPA